MAAILRWLYLSGKRHRVYFRYGESLEQRELVLAGPGWEHSVSGLTAKRLEDLPEEMLLDLVRQHAPAEITAH